MIFEIDWRAITMRKIEIAICPGTVDREGKVGFVDLHICAPSRTDVLQGKRGAKVVCPTLVPHAGQETSVLWTLDGMSLGNNRRTTESRQGTKVGFEDFHERTGVCAMHFLEPDP